MLFTTAAVATTTIGVMVGTGIVGLTVYVGPSVAAWLSTSATAISVSVSSAIDSGSQLIYRAGPAIKEMFTGAPLIPMLSGT